MQSAANVSNPDAVHRFIPVILLGIAVFAISTGCASPKVHIHKQWPPLKTEQQTAPLTDPQKAPIRLAALDPASALAHATDKPSAVQPAPPVTKKTFLAKKTAVRKAHSKVKKAKALKRKTALKRKKAPRSLPLGSAPYRVFGVKYYPMLSAEGFDEEGLASWYGLKFHGRRTSNREVYDMNGMTAAHKTLPFGTHVKVINLENNLSVVVRINDRGPFVGDRLIDLSYAAAQKLKMSKKGLAPVRVIALADTDLPTKQTAPAKPRYAVQVAVFKDLENAHQLKRKLENKKIQAYSVKGSRNVRVLAGKYSDFNPAYQLQKKIRKLGYSDALIVVNRIQGLSAP